MMGMPMGMPMGQPMGMPMGMPMGQPMPMGSVQMPIQGTMPSMTMMMGAPMMQGAPMMMQGAPMMMAPQGECKLSFSSIYQIYLDNSLTRSSSFLCSVLQRIIL